jgi:hypothetical protein
MQAGIQEQENIQLIRLIMLNISYILNKYSSQNKRKETIGFFMDYLLPVSIRLPKQILFAVKIVHEVLSTGIRQDNETQSRINHGIRMTIVEDVRRCHERTPEELSRLIGAVR